MQKIPFFLFFLFFWHLLNLNPCLTRVDPLYIFLSVLFRYSCVPPIFIPSSSSSSGPILSSRAYWSPPVKMCSSPSSLWPTCLRGWWRYSTPVLDLHSCMCFCFFVCVCPAGALHAGPPWHSCILSPPSSHVWEGCTGMCWTCLPSGMMHNYNNCNYKWSPIDLFKL